MLHGNYQIWRMLAPHLVQHVYIRKCENVYTHFSAITASSRVQPEHVRLGETLSILQMSIRTDTTSDVTFAVLD